MNRYLLLLTAFIISFSISSTELLGLDSGKKGILLHKNSVKSSTAILIIGGIHGDEGETVQVVDYIRKQLEKDKKISLYFIPSINPTLYSITELIGDSVKEVKGRRGYLLEHLDDEGYVKPGSELTDFEKETFYRIFYGSDNTYKNVIEYYVDPNRDFVNRKLPSTRILLDYIDSIKNDHKSIIILSFHGYMTGGRVYPEYMLSEGKVIINEAAWEMAQVIGDASGYVEERLYPPAIPIIERFEGELISYTGKIKNLTGLDIELDKDHHTDNKKRSLDGVKALIEYLSNLPE